MDRERGPVSLTQLSVFAVAGGATIVFRNRKAIAQSVFRFASRTSRCVMAGKDNKCFKTSTGHDGELGKVNSTSALPFTPSSITSAVAANIDLFLSSTNDEPTALAGLLNDMGITSVQAEVLRHCLLHQPKAPTRGFLPTDALFALLRPPLVVLKTLFSWLSDAFCLALHGYVPGSGAERKMKAPLKFKVRGASARNALERLKRRLRKTGTKRRMAFSLRRRHKTKKRSFRVKRLKKALKALQKALRPKIIVPAAAPAVLSPPTLPPSPTLVPSPTSMAASITEVEYLPLPVLPLPDAPAQVQTAAPKICVFGERCKQQRKGTCRFIHPEAF